MITFDVLTLGAFIKQEKDYLAGARINKIRQPNRREFVFSLRNNSISREFYINIEPQMYHICFMSKENLQKRHLEYPDKPPMFCMQLRKYLENARISKINQPENERILELFVETYSETGDRIYLCLAIELMGKYSNVILYNYDTGVIIGCAHNVGTEKSREREIYGGIPYIYPPAQIKGYILTFNGEINYDSLSNDFYGFSVTFAKYCNGQDLNTLKSFVLLEDLKPALSQDLKEYCIYGNLLKNPVYVDDVNSAIDTYYANQIEDKKFHSLQLRYKTEISQKLKKLQNSITVMNNELTSGAAGDKFRLWGDLIMANLYNLQDYAAKVNVFDYENSKDIIIELDPLKTLKENANHFYKKYNKSKTAVKKLSTLLEDANQKAMYYEQILYSVEAAQNLEELYEITPETDAKTNTTKKTGKPDITKVELADGSRIFIGKNNRQNDYIVSKLADEDDLWFHVHNCAGSHVLLKSLNPTNEMILQCAKLAKEYSTAKNSVKAGVIYTKRKYLKKPPAAALGYVTYRNEKEIIV